METLIFTDDETGEEIEFAVLSAIQYKEDGYILVADLEELEKDEVTAIVMIASFVEGDDIIYEIVEDDELLEIVFPMLEDEMEDF